jgi:hypothetical protein
MRVSGGAVGMAAASGIEGASGGVAVIAGGLANDWSITIAVFVGRLHFQNSCWKVKVALRCWVFVGWRAFDLKGPFKSAFSLRLRS